MDRPRVPLPLGADYPRGDAGGRQVLFLLLPLDRPRHRDPLPRLAPRPAPRALLRSGKLHPRLDPIRALGVEWPRPAVDRSPDLQPPPRPVRPRGPRVGLS